MRPYFWTCVALIVADIINCYLVDHNCTISNVTKIIGNDLTRSFFASGGITMYGTIDVGTFIGAIWFLPAMFFAFLFFQALLALTEKDIYLGISSMAVSVLGIISAQAIWFPFSIQSGMMAVFFLYLGYEIKKHRLLERIRWYHYVVAQIILLYGIYQNYCYIDFAGCEIGDFFLSVPISLAGCLLIYLVSKPTRFKLHNLFTQILEFIGKRSLDVLCVHLFAINTMQYHVDRMLAPLDLTGNLWGWGVIVVEIIVAVAGAVLVECGKKIVENKYGSGKRTLKLSLGRDMAIDVSKGILIFLTMVGHYAIAGNLRNIIYSFHMAAFVVLSGYFHNGSRSISHEIRRTMKTFLLPYFVYSLCAIAFSARSKEAFAAGLIQYLSGVSFTRRILTDIPTVGPVYFILMLFVIRLLYSLIDHVVQNPWAKGGAIIGVGLIGLFLGRRGYWLPWSVDVACVLLIFYHLGVLLRRWDLLALLKNNKYLYFVLAPIWVYMIWMGGMEISVRNYGWYGLTILGATAGTVLLYCLSDYITHHLPIIASVLSYLGKATLYILCTHTLLYDSVNDFVSHRFSEENFTFLVFTILLQILISAALWAIRLLCVNYGSKKRQECRT